MKTLRSKDGKRVTGWSMSEDSYHYLREEYSGLCRKCGETRDGDTEPDAENYRCDSCGTNNVSGVENLLVEGLIFIEEEAK